MKIITKILPPVLIMLLSACIGMHNGIGSKNPYVYNNNKFSKERIYYDSISNVDNFSMWNKLEINGIKPYQHLVLDLYEKETNAIGEQKIVDFFSGKDVRKYRVVVSKNTMRKLKGIRSRLYNYIPEKDSCIVIETDLYEDSVKYTMWQKEISPDSLHVIGYLSYPAYLYIEFD